MISIQLNKIDSSNNNKQPQKNITTLLEGWKFGGWEWGVDGITDIFRVVHAKNLHLSGEFVTALANQTHKNW